MLSTKSANRFCPRALKSTRKINSSIMSNYSMGAPGVAKHIIVADVRGGLWAEDTPFGSAKRLLLILCREQVRIGVQRYSDIAMAHALLNLLCGEL